VSNDASWGIAWTFDQWGNRLNQTPQGLAVGRVLNPPNIGYVNNRDTSYTYDAAGNQTNDGLHNYTFNAENQITQMDGGAATYAYDGEARRMKKYVLATNETTYYFYGVGGLLCEFTTTNTGATVAASSDRVLYKTSDKLGSAVLLLNTSGTVIENNRTFPYGEPWLPDTASTNDKRFTTYHRDSESNLDYTMRRYYSATAGRFLSADPTFKNIHLGEPQSWNMYICVMDDPINSADPTGEFSLRKVWQAVNRVFGAVKQVADILGINQPKTGLYALMEAQDFLLTADVKPDCNQMLSRAFGPDMTFERLSNHVLNVAEIDEARNSNVPFSSLFPPAAAAMHELITRGYWSKIR
jgi:RHS repeat-associated protein